ncbi:MAG: 23S rRNA (uracil(1939)-C(5))-methyltransferase RlmD [Oscillospiraceae bacterium]|jgi:23S rRNA (uracil1939-C5)-methyltransferase|nr:23S rRNA (uracil(1939)-C(5))-methyltransferase RlmD [Oscillospiraceae bacterium]
MDFKKNDELLLAITGYNSEGYGVARASGRVIFVQRALRGELVRARILKVTNNAAYAKTIEITEPSPCRAAPECMHFGKCGGCSLLHMTYAEELEYKREKVKEAFARIAGIDAVVPPVAPSPETLGYRNKAIFRAATIDGRAVTGFYRERSHDITPIGECPFQPGGANIAARVLRQWMDEYGVLGYGDLSGEGIIRHLFYREGRGTGKAQIVIIAAQDNIPRLEELTRRLRAEIPGLASILLRVNWHTGNIVLRGKRRLLWGDDELEDTLMGLKFGIDHMAFYQVNHAQTEKLYGCALDFAELSDRDEALDIYCGAGTITLLASRRAGRVTGVELVPEAIESAEHSAERNGITNAGFTRADAAQYMSERAENGSAPSVVIVDPPRRGLSPEVISATERLAPGRIVYVSCNPATLARDCELFARHGYKVSCVRAFDMFPRTVHVETVTLLRKA